MVSIGMRSVHSLQHRLSPSRAHCVAACQRLLALKAARSGKKLPAAAAVQLWLCSTASGGGSGSGSSGHSRPGGVQNALVAE